MNRLEKADYISKLIPGYQYLCSAAPDAVTSPHLLTHNYGCNATSITDVQAAGTNGIDANDIYYTQPDKQRKQIELSFGKCRFVTGSLEEMQMIDEIAAAHLAEGHLEIIGLQVIPDTYDDGHQYGFRASELSELAARFRSLQNISIRGCFIAGNIADLSGSDLIHHYRLCYETAKLVTTAIPCGMSYVCFGACTEAVYQSYVKDTTSLPEICQTAQIVRHQNDTAFYARLLTL